MNQEIGRREWLVGAAAGLAAISCNRLIPSSLFRESQGRQRLMMEIDTLLSSPIKNLLQQRVKTIYQSPPPLAVIYGAGSVQEIKVVDSNVYVFTDPEVKSAIGEFMFRGEVIPNTNVLYPTRNTYLQIPLPGLEFQKRHRKMPIINRDSILNRASDGTIYAEIPFFEGEEIYEGIYPTVSITVPPSLSLRPPHSNRLERDTSYAYLRQACSHLISDLYLHEMLLKMREMNLDPFLEVRETHGIKKVEGVTQSFAKIMGNEGTLRAALDIASQLLTFKATYGSSLNDPKYDQPNFSVVRPKMEEIKLGNDPRDILNNSLAWALNTPEARLNLVFEGSFGRLP